MKKFKLLSPIMAGTLLASPLICLTSCNGLSKEQILETLVKSTIQEFKEFGKHPRASTMLDEIQMYLLNWGWSHGYLPMMDNAGNIWFDVPATSGKEKYPRMILQGHMDMVFRYDLEQTGPGLKDVPDPRTHVIELEEKEIQDQSVTRKVIQSKDQFTSIGADDGIGIAMILAIITNPYISHGPLRCVFTTDEEEGLVGAKALSRVVFEDCNYILNFDGEGKPDREDIICSGCSGFCEYQFKHEFEKTTETRLANSFKIEISGLRGQHYMDETYIAYKQDGNHAPANADRMMLAILNAIPAGSNFQIESFTHYNSKKEEVDVEARQLPDNATVIINTDYTSDENVMLKLINKTIDDAYKAQYKEELWDNVKINVTPNSTPSEYFLDKTNSKLLTTVYGNEVYCGILDWEGSDHAEKIAKNYPAKSCNVSSFKVAKQAKGGEKMVFSIGARGMANTVANLESCRDNFITNWKKIGADNEYTTIKYYHPWDTSVYNKLINFTAQAYREIGVEPSIEKTRGGVEPAFFAVAKPGIEQVVIGPRIDDIHTPKETLFIDSIPTPMAVAVLVIENINNLK